MKFKIDENLPAQFAEILQDAGFDALTVLDQNLKGTIDSKIIEICQQEDRALITLDLDFADIRSCPPSQYPGILVLRTKRQDKIYLISLFQKVLPLFYQESINHQL
ncbi:MAG: DUF5615 family PIN-like protein [Acaryochloridaceae cyanobacterium CSU_3_4]|nr:DUF5615 family PIN-like protein [Acaryochloridaceae cyanobacterium CSU_3_4]